MTARLAELQRVEPLEGLEVLPFERRCSKEPKGPYMVRAETDRCRSQCRRGDFQDVDLISECQGRVVGTGNHDDVA